jgi:hypothetical protein
MTRHPRLTLVATFALLAAAATGCDNETASENSDDTAASDADAEATVKKAATKSPLAEFFQGSNPEGVKLTKGYTAYDPRYTMTIPKTWKTGGNRADSYMAMRRDSTAAVFCAWGPMSVKKVKTLAKRAPALGKDVVLDEKVETFTMGSKTEFPARVGSAKGTFFGTKDSQLYWMDVAYHDSYNGSATTGTVHCVAMIEAGAEATVVAETQAIMRGFGPPSGKKLIADRKAELFDDGKK